MILFYSDFEDFVEDITNMTIVISIYATPNCSGVPIASVEKAGIQGECYITTNEAVLMGCVESTGGYFINEYASDNCVPPASTAYEVQDETTCVSLNTISMTSK